MNRLRLAGIFSDYMVLQSNIPVPVWGWAEKGENVIVEFMEQIKMTTADENGCWMVKLDPLKPDFSPQTMTITANETLYIKDILVGEVWISSGQSNMNNSLEELSHNIESISTVRFFLCTPNDKNHLQTDFAKGEWLPCDTNYYDKIKSFSCIGAIFGKELQEKLNVPIGIINVSRSASIAESWTPYEDLKKMPGYKSVEEKLEKIETSDFNAPGYLYKNCINPLIPFAIAGVIWYQGESNSIRAEHYAELLKTMINSWRGRWNQGDFPFISVQLPNYDNSLETPLCCSGSWKHMREAQLKILELPNTALAVTVDIGDSADLHPRNKPEAAHRLVIAALGKVYKKDIVYSGPIYKSMQIEDNKIKLRFEHTGGGLVAKDGNLEQFKIAGKDRVFLTGKAIICGDEVIVSNENIKEPGAVRYAWDNDPAGCNLFNKEGLPASPFRTDIWNE